MDDAGTRALGKTAEGAQADRNQAIKTVLGMLSKSVAVETASFMVDTSHQLYPQAMRGRPDTPAATSLREYHFTILMNQVLTAYAAGRGQEFADGRFALDNLLREEPEHQPLAERFCRLMGLWLQEAHNKRQQEKLETEQRRKRQREERKMRKEQEMNLKKAGKKSNKKINERNDGRRGTDWGDDSSSSLDIDEQDSDVGDEAQTSPAPIRAKSIFDLAGRIDTDEDASSSDDEETSSDKK